MTRLKILASGVDHITEETINLLKIAEELKISNSNISVIEALDNFRMP